MPDDGNALRLHHVGYMAKTEAEFQAAIAKFKADKFPTAIEGSIPGQLDFYYADTVPLLGHYTELVCMKPGGTYFANVPHN